MAYGVISGSLSNFGKRPILAQDKAKLILRAVACPPLLDYRITGNRMSVKGAEGAAKPFTLDGQSIFC